MKRREMLGMLGATGLSTTLGATLGSTAGAAPGHGAAKGAEAKNPLSGGHAHFCGIHVLKFQLVTQHFCSAHSDEMFQCMLFDSAASNAKLLGVEYIISDKQYRALPQIEKKYWHPHTYEVLAGGLIAPDMPPEEERKFMKMILTTWGKTWHTWPDPTTPVPIGEPLLMWSVTGDGQLSEKVVALRDREFNVSAAAIRQRRCEELGMEVPEVSFPKSINDVGRQWTSSGPDKPTMRKK